jgi:hypothetical protein
MLPTAESMVTLAIREFHYCLVQTKLLQKKAKQAGKTQRLLEANKACQMQQQNG